MRQVSIQRLNDNRSWFHGNRQAFNTKLPRHHVVRAREAVQVALPYRLGIELQVVRCSTLWAAIGNQLLLGPRLKSNIESLGYGNRSHTISAIKILVQYGEHRCIG